MLQSANAIEIRGKLQIAQWVATFLVLPSPCSNLQKLSVPEKHEDFKTCFPSDKKKEECWLNTLTECERCIYLFA